MKRKPAWIKYRDIDNNRKVNKNASFLLPFYTHISQLLAEMAVNQSIMDVI